MEMDMRKFAADFYCANIKKGDVTKLNNYSFTFVTKPKKDKDLPKSTVYMLSYFWEK